MSRTEIILDSSRYSVLLDEKLKKKSIERLRPSDVFSEAYYRKDENERRKIDEIAESTYKNKLKNIWNQEINKFTDASADKCFLGNLTYHNRDASQLKKDYFKKCEQEKEIQERQEKFIQNTSARKQKLFREFSSNIVLGDEENTRIKMISYVSNTVDNANKNSDDELKKYRQMYPAYSNILNDENMYIYSKLSKSNITKLKTDLNLKTDINECVARLLTPDTLKYYKDDLQNKNMNLKRDTRRFRCTHYEEEYNLNKVMVEFTPGQKNLSSKLHGSEFYNKAINTKTIYFVKFKLKNLCSNCSEKVIQDIAAKCDSFVYQLNIELDPVIWNPRGTATGKLRFFGKGLEKFFEKLHNELGAEAEIIGEIQKEEIN